MLTQTSSLARVQGSICFVEVIQKCIYVSVIRKLFMMIAIYNRGLQRIRKIIYKFGCRVETRRERKIMFSLVISDMRL